MEDLGRPIAHLALQEGVPVYTPDGERIGVVDHVVTAGEDDRIFEGLIVHTLPLPGRHLYAHYDQIAELHERGVLLSVPREDLYELTESSGRRDGSANAVEGRLEAALRRAWDWVSGVP